MKLKDFFADLEQDYNITMIEWCRAKNFNYQSITNYICGGIPRRNIAEKIVAATADQVRLIDLGIDK